MHDRLHLQNHQESCRKSALNPDLYEELNGVNTEVAEQFFSHLLNFVKLFTNTCSVRAKIWIILIFHQWNLKKELKINNSAPSPEQLKKIPQLKNVKRYKGGTRKISDKSEKKRSELFCKIKANLLKPWVRKDLMVHKSAKRRKVM